MNDSAAPETPLFADDQACADAIGRVAEIDRDLQRIEAGKNEAVATAAKAAETLAEPLIGARIVLVARVEAYATAHRVRLTDGGKRKTAPFTTGEGVWRKGRDTVSIDATEADAIVKKLKGMGKGFLRFIKVTESLKKTALNDATDDEKARLRKIKGLAFIAGAESFAVEPIALPIAERPQ